MVLFSRSLNSSWNLSCLLISLPAPLNIFLLPLSLPRFPAGSLKCWQGTLFPLSLPLSPGLLRSQLSLFVSLGSLLSCQWVKVLSLLLVVGAGVQPALWIPLLCCAACAASPPPCLFPSADPSFCGQQSGLLLSYPRLPSALLTHGVLTLALSSLPLIPASPLAVFLLSLIISFSLCLKPKESSSTYW